MPPVSGVLLPLSTDRGTIRNPMVVRAMLEGWYLVTQPEHARLAGELARHWAFPRPATSVEPELLEAVARHDSGWASDDAEPTLRVDGSPIDFLAWPLASAIEAWERSIAEARSLGPTAGYVVTRHFWLLGRMARLRPLASEDRAALERFLREYALAVTDEDREQKTLLLQVCDVISLHLIMGGKMEMSLLESVGIASHYQDDTLLLEPFPFDAALTLECPARFLRRRRSRAEPAANMRFTLRPLS